MHPEKVEPVIQKYLNYAKDNELWHAKKSLEWALKKIKKRIKKGKDLKKAP